MAGLRNRRDFLKAAGAGVAAGMGAQSEAAADYPAQDQPSGSVEVRVTDASRKFAPEPHLEWHTAGGASSTEPIHLNASIQFQEHLGFGGAFTDAACTVFHQLSAPAREALFHEMFHPSEMGLSAGRICIGSSDYSREVYSFDEGAPDPDLSRFSIDHDRSYILPVLRQARSVNPKLWLLASPWSPPGWMKPNGSMLGGCMHPSTMPVYAHYFVKFLQAYQKEGVQVNSVTSQNEVDTEQDGRMPACAFPQEYEISFIADHLGPAIKKSGLGTRIWLLDHNYNLWGRVVCSLQDRGLREYCNAVAWHGYVGAPDMMSRVHNAYPEVEMFWTEGGPDITQPDYTTDWSNWGRTFTGVLRNWCRSVIGWNLALDEKGKPNIGPFSCGGTVTIHSGTGEITRSGHFWAMNHFARSIRQGARRFHSQGGPAEVWGGATRRRPVLASGLYHVAYQNPNGQKALVLTNVGNAKTVQVQSGRMAVEVAVAADAITSLHWS